MNMYTVKRIEMSIDFEMHYERTKYYYYYARCTRGVVADVTHGL